MMHPDLPDLRPQTRQNCASPHQDAVEWRRCSEIARAHGRTFFLASRFLPPDRRRAIHATHAYCRIADDITDRSADPVAAARALDAWERQLDAPTDPIAVAFATVRSCHGVPVAAGREQLAGVRMDLTPCQFATWEELRPYAIGWPGRLA
jgi:phytoene synthase